METTGRSTSGLQYCRSSLPRSRKEWAVKPGACRPSTCKAARSARVPPRREGMKDQARSSPQQVMTKPASVLAFISARCRLR